MLKIQNLSVSYRNRPALNNVNLEVKSQQWVSVIGANGAGKSSLLQAVTNLAPQQHGSIFFEGQDITNLSSVAINKLGIALVAEGRQIFPSLTVLENLLAICPGNDIKALTDTLDHFPRLCERRHQKAGTLSGGEQQMLAIAQAIIKKPKLLLCDEPSLGLSPIMVNTIFDILTTFYDQGMSLLLVEQNVRKSLEKASYGYVLEKGQVVLEGNSADLLNNPKLERAYLGL